MKKKTPPSPFDACGARFDHDNVLLGIHYGDMSNHEGRDMRNHPLNVWAYFEDYLEYMGDDMLKTSFADFWRWWYVMERYKGDEKGLGEFERILDACFAKGLKVKATIAWNTWWALDKDWEVGAPLPLGPEDLDDWIHLCDLLARRFKGRIALWDLQGEANSLEHYWQKAPIEHVFEMYKTGYRAIKRIDPACLIGASGASPSVPQAAMDEWYEANLTACKGYYDNVPINFFADVADPYGGGMPFYNSIRGMLDKLGLQGVEIGMGETSVQWAETTETAATDSLTHEKQAWRLNEAYGNLMTAGMNKIISWATEFAPGGGWWPWRWGLRNFEDWWGIWPDTHKVPGTRIVYRYDKKMEDGSTKTYDLRPEWARPADPYYPSGEIFDFWCQLAPAGSEAIRLPMTAEGPSEGFFMRVASYQQTRDELVALVYNEQPAPIRLKIDTAPTGWPEGTALSVEEVNESIDFKTGFHTKNRVGADQTRVTAGGIALELPPGAGFTTIRVRPAAPDLAALYEGAVIAKQVEVGREIEAHVAVRNVGAASWEKRRVALYPYHHGLAAAKAKPSRKGAGKLLKSVAPAESSSIAVTLPPADSAGRVSFGLRLYDADSGWFGPMYCVSTLVADREAPRKLVAHRELGHVRLNWFAPESREGIHACEIHRADGFEKAFSLLATVAATDRAEFIDENLKRNKHYYYRVVGIRNDGSRTRFSNEDNAQALSKPRIYDAEIVSHTVPSQVRIGDVQEASVTIRNTGSKTWDLTRPEKIRYWWQTTQIWGCREEKQLAGVTLEGRDAVAPGEEVTLRFPYVGPKVGTFENHWIMRMEVIDSVNKNGLNGPVQYAYFGTPLLFETIVRQK